MNQSSPDDPAASANANGAGQSNGTASDSTIVQLIRSLLRGLRWGRNGEGSARDTLNELIEEREGAEVPLDDDERTLLANILHLRDRSAEDVMIPRADIVAVAADATLADVIKLMTSTGHSRIPVYRETLDDAIGMVHVKDVLAWRGEEADFSLEKIRRRVLFVAPSMEVLELLLEMRVKRSHMALVVDEFGGVDGLVTIEDLVEEIVGEIEDEHDVGTEPNVVTRPDGTIDAEARAPIEVLEQRFGAVLSEEEREDVDTLGGLVFYVAGRIPIRGELITHSSGIEFEILEADPRRVRRLRVRGPSVEPTTSTKLSANGSTNAHP